DTNIQAITAQLDLLLRRIVARLAQTLQLAGDEVGPVAPMRRDVIDHVRRRHDSALQTELAQRMLHQLKLAQPLPACGFVEAIPRNRASGSRHEYYSAAWPVSSTNFSNKPRNSSTAPCAPLLIVGIAR